LIGKENHKKKHPQASTSPEVPEDKSSSTYDTKATDALSISNDDLARSQEKPRKPIESILKNMSKSNKKTYRVPIGMQKKIAAVEDMDESGPLEVSPNLDE